MRDSVRILPNPDAKDEERAEENVNFFYNTNYVALEGNLEQLKERVDEDFYFQEDAICELIKQMDAIKGNFLQRLDRVEAEYKKILQSGQTVLSQIEKSSKRVDEFERTERHFVGFVGNLRKLEGALTGVPQPNPPASKSVVDQPEDLTPVSLPAKNSQPPKEQGKSEGADDDTFSKPKGPSN